MADAQLTNPQSFNGYAYAHNNPVNSTDPGGTCIHDGVDDGKPCANFSGQVYKNAQGYFGGPVAGGTAYNGPNVQLNVYGATYQIVGGANGGYTRIDPVAVQATNDGVLTTTSSAFTSTISSRPMLSLPCVSGIPCGSSAPSPPSLDMTNVEPLKTVAAIDAGAEALQLIPVLNVPASIIRLFIAGGRGDAAGVGINLASVALPGLGALKRAGTAVHVAEDVAEGSHLVYQGINPATKAIEYVGTTARDPLIRFGEHLNSGTARSALEYFVIDGAKGLTKTQARVLEQKLINQHGLSKYGGTLLNKINSIAPKYWAGLGIQ